MNIYNLIKEEINNIIDEDLWHGSPHDFEEFLLDYVGSGEGAQAFGWGLYFTELEGIADRYSRIKNNILSIAEHIYGLDYTNKDVENLESMKNDEIIQLINNKFVKDSIMLKKRFVNRPDKMDFYKHLQNTKISLRDRYVNDLKNSNPTKYYIKLKNNKSIKDLNWLKWDKPIENAQIDQILKQFKKINYNGRVKYVDDGFFIYYSNTDKRELNLGKDFYRALAGDVGFSEKRVSLFLLDAGIDGIKYPAESISRGKTSENARGFNYVIFDPSIIKIEKKVKY